MQIVLLVILTFHQHQASEVQQVKLILQLVIRTEAVHSRIPVGFSFEQVVLPTVMVGTLNLKLVLEMEQQSQAETLRSQQVCLPQMHRVVVQLPSLQEREVTLM